MRPQDKASKLMMGYTIISREPGNSMTPILKSRQPVRLEPVELNDLQKGDIVFCKVKGRYYTHKVTAVSRSSGVQIGNNHGHINGWTRNVYGRVTEILPMGYKGK